MNTGGGLFPSGSQQSPFGFGQSGSLLGASPRSQVGVVAPVTPMVKESRASEASKEPEALVVSPAKVEASAPIAVKAENVVPTVKEPAALPARPGVSQSTGISVAQVESFRSRVIEGIMAGVAPVMENLMQRMTALEEIVKSGARSDVQCQAAVMEKLESIRKELSEVREVTEEKQSASPEPCVALPSGERWTDFVKMAEIPARNSFPVDAVLSTSSGSEKTRRSHTDSDRDYERVEREPERERERDDDRNRRRRREERGDNRRSDTHRHRTSKPTSMGLMDHIARHSR